ncbi:MAG: P-loop containing nucleoside triphosphate hydrolase protein [Benniella sp.]|nr:MAG: P-loop containing nucleoside triphosphate hydrolase protein [Benniella sp.]
MNLNSELLCSVHGYGLQVPTKLQQDALPFLIDGRDVVLDAPVNSGKTTTACITVLQRVDTSNMQCQAVILTLSPETASRILKVIVALDSHDIQYHVFTDHAYLREHRRRLKIRAQIVIGTPSYVEEMIRHGDLTIKNISVLVLDRVDELFSGGGRRVVGEIFRFIPRRAQVIFLLSRTFQEPRDLTTFGRTPVFIAHCAEKLDKPEPGQDKADDFVYRNLKPGLLRGIYEYGLKRPSPLHQRVIPPILKNLDVIIQAPSGIDTIAAFSISILQKLDNSNAMGRGLVLVPTQVLAQQIQNVVGLLGKHMDIQFQGLNGKTNIKGFHSSGTRIVAMTPGSMLKKSKRRNFRTSSIKVLVAYEVDEMISKGFRGQVDDVFQRLPKGTQVVFLSTTMPKEITEIMTKFNRKPIHIEVKKEDLSQQSFKQFYVAAEREERKLDAMCSLCETSTASRVVIFCNTIQKLRWLKEELTSRQFTVSVIHGLLTQTRRDVVIEEFCSGLFRILISTDLNLHDIDFQQLSLVINYELANFKEKNYRRIALVGDLGRKGVVINLVSKSEMSMLKETERFYSSKIPEFSSNDTKWLQ